MDNGGEKIAIVLMAVAAVSISFVIGKNNPDEVPLEKILTDEFCNSLEYDEVTRSREYYECSEFHEEFFAEYIPVLFDELKNLNSTTHSDNVIESATEEKIITTIDEIPDYFNDVDLSKYGVEIIRIGGNGSRINQKTAYLLTEHGYLNPADDWVSTVFNSPADLIHVWCRDGYRISSCVVDLEDCMIEENKCSCGLEDMMKNVIGIQCEIKN